jgi:chemotaxis methyl-accepting protein methylase
MMPVGEIGFTRRVFLLAGAMMALGNCGRKASVKQAVSAKISKLLTEVKTTDNYALIEKDLLELSRTPGGPRHLLPFLEEGTFLQFYYSAKALTHSPSQESDAVIGRLLSPQNESWERALGFILLGERFAPEPDQERQKSILRSFILDTDTLIQLGALVGLIRLGRTDVLLSFAEQDHHSQLAQKIVSLTRDADLPGLLRRGVFVWEPATTYITSFFRYSDLLEEMRRDFAAHSQAEYVVWDIGCSSGLSTESIRVALLADGGGKSRLRLLGTDLDPLAVIYAARRIYLLEAPDPIELNLGPRELDNYYTFAQIYGWDPAAVLGRFFVKRAGVFAPLYESKHDPGEISYEWDDVTAAYSPLQDESVDAVVYTNVDHQLDDAGRFQVRQKIFRKLKPGGRVFYIQSSREPYKGLADFSAVFGGPLKVKNGFVVFVKR